MEGKLAIETDSELDCFRALRVKTADVPPRYVFK